MVVKQWFLFSKRKSEVLRLRTSDFKNSTISIIISLTFDYIFTHFAVLAAQRHPSVVLWCTALSFLISKSPQGVPNGLLGQIPEVGKQATSWPLGSAHRRQNLKAFDKYPRIDLKNGSTCPESLSDNRRLGNPPDSVSKMSSKMMRFSVRKWCFLNDDRFDKINFNGFSRL